MALPLFNSIASWWLKKRIHQIELFLKYPGDVQYEVLQKLLDQAQNTEWGRTFDFGSIRNYEDFRTRIPVVHYEDIADTIDRTRKGEQQLFWSSDIKWFAKSSGTTNAKSKFIPVSQEALIDCHFKSGKDLLCLYLNNNPESKLFTGKSLRLGGSKELYKDNGSYFGDLSAILIDNMPKWAEYSSTPSNKVSLMSNWEDKLRAIIAESIPENVTSLAGVPSWMLVLLNQLLKEQSAENLAAIWPHLEVYFHGGVAFTPYREQFKKILPADSKCYEIYNASEGFFAIQDQNFSNELLLMLDYGIFYEFIPMEQYTKDDPFPKAIPLWEVEKDVNYAMLITTNAGLWRYCIGDTVRFTSTAPYRINISGRTKHHINVFGEELVIENAEKALDYACRITQSEVIEYTVAPIFMDSNQKGAHQWLIEFKIQPADLQLFEQLLDDELRKLNSDYDAKRNADITLSQLKLNAASPGLFYRWMKQKNKLGGQHKVPRLSNNRDFLEELLELEAELV